MKTPLEPYSVSPAEAARLMGISRSRVYELKDAAELPWYHDGRRTMFLVSGIKERIARLMSAPPSTGPLLSGEERKLARQRATEPLLPPEQQQLAGESESEPLALEPAGEQQPASEPPDHDYALLFRERLQLIRGNYADGSDEAYLRAREHVVSACRANTGLDLERATKLVLAAIERISIKGTTAP